LRAKKAGSVFLRRLVRFGLASVIHSTVPLLFPLPAQDYTNNTDSWKDTKLPYFPEFVDFRVSYCFLMLYRKS
jgi:hypothetical protein